MPYKIQFRKRATKEYLDAISWYRQRSQKSADNFVLIVDQTLDLIEKQPYRFRIIYKNFHQVKTKKYPFNIVYFIEEESQFIIITSLFHDKRNPATKFKS
ncbi:MAG TPA: type II toxin-antitoxin system RelE/ParE family toxin [Hanamia sp.]|nr:type II toxin-antitoxin system RelE/ParE family toxin [Hanamia sp.]